MSYFWVGGLRGAYRGPGLENFLAHELDAPWTQQGAHGNSHGHHPRVVAIISTTSPRRRRLPACPQPLKHTTEYSSLV